MEKIILLYCTRLSEAINMPFLFQVQDKLRALQGERERLTANWESKQKWLETTYQEQVFYRDIEHMEKITNSQEVGTQIHMRFTIVWALDFFYTNSLQNKHFQMINGLGRGFRQKSPLVMKISVRK